MRSKPGNLYRRLSSFSHFRCCMLGVVYIRSAGCMKAKCTRPLFPYQRLPWVGLLGSQKEATNVTENVTTSHEYFHNHSFLCQWHAEGVKKRQQLDEEFRKEYLSQTYRFSIISTVFYLELDKERVKQN